METESNPAKFPPNKVNVKLFCLIYKAGHHVLEMVGGDGLPLLLPPGAMMVSQY